MTLYKLTVDFSANRYSDDKLACKALSIILALTGNTNFPTLAEMVADIKQKYDIYNFLLVKSSEGGKFNTLSKNNARKELEIVLSNTAFKVLEISDGNEILILNSGFDPSRKRSLVGILDRPAGVNIKPGPMRGSLLISWNVVAHALMYEVEYCLAPSSSTSVKTRMSTTKHKIEIPNLIRGNAYAVRITAAGTHPVRVWSDEIICYVM